MDREAVRRTSPQARIAAIRGQHAERTLEIQRSTIDEKARTVELSVASDAPYQRWWGTEILDMASGSIRQDRLKSGFPLLVGHDSGDQVGVVESYSIGADKKLRVLARFGRSARAQEIFQDVVDGIRVNTSIGYQIHDLQLEQQQGDVATYRVVDWEPLEASLVAVPADITVGVGREATINSFRGKNMKTPEEGNASASAAGVQLSAEAERQRILSLTAAGREYADMGGNEIAQRLIANPNGTMEMFKSYVLDVLRGRSTGPTVTASPGTGAPSQSEPLAYGEGLRLRYQHGPLKAFTRDFAVERGGVMKAEEAAFRAGMWLAAVVHDKGFAKRWCRDHAMPLLYRASDGEIREITGNEIRSQNEAMLGSGAALVPVEMEAAIIMLRDQYGAARRLARIRPMSSDTLKIPRRKTGLQAYFFADDDGVGLTESTKNWDNVTLSTKKLGVLNKLSKDLTEDSVISAVDDSAQEQAYAFAVKEDQCLLIGDGTSTYAGMTGIITKMEASAYVSRTALQTGHDTMAEVDNIDVTSVMGAVAQYADTPGAVFVCSNLFKHGIFSRLQATAGGNNLNTLGQSPADSFLGHQIITSEAMPKVTTTLANKIMFLYGRFDLGSSMGSRRGIEVQVLQERYAELGLIGVISTERFDLVVHDLGTTSTSDVNGGRGPIAAAYGA